MLQRQHKQVLQVADTESYLGFDLDPLRAAAPFGDGQDVDVVSCSASRVRHRHLVLVLRGRKVEHPRASELGPGELGLYACIIESSSGSQDPRKVAIPLLPYLGVWHCDNQRHTVPCVLSGAPVSPT